jgi:hypothetical protein
MSYYDLDKIFSPNVVTTPRPGYNLTSEYLSSGLPWVTSSTIPTNFTQEYQFQNVTKFITIINNAPTGNILKIGFTKNGVEGTNYIELNGNSSIRLDYRVTCIFLRSSYNISYSIAAGLTAVPREYAPVLTGSINGPDGSWEGVG